MLLRLNRRVAGQGPDHQFESICAAFVRESFHKRGRLRPGVGDASTWEGPPPMPDER